MLQTRRELNMLRPLLAALLITLGSFYWVQHATGQSSTSDIWLIEIEGAIGPATSDHVVRGIQEANAESANLIILRMNTPGGLDAAMRLMIQEILASPVPVATWVGPQGARAASAGTYISYASHVAAMAHATNLGAATPVQIASPSMPGPAGEGAEEEVSSEPSAMEKKMMNDAAAYIRGLAELRGRNAEWAEEAVFEGVSLNAEEALALNVIDLIAENIDELIEALDGMTVQTQNAEVVIDTSTGELRVHETDLRTEILSIITNPSMILILGMIGIYGIILEFYNPGALVPGVVGIICLLLAGYAVQLLPLNYAGLALIVVGIALMVSEAFVPSFGILGIGGVIAFSIGGLMLFDTEMEAYQVGIPTIAATAAVSALIIFATVSIALRMRRQAVTTGTHVLVGQLAECMTDINGVRDEGQVRVGGEIWRASAASPIQAGQDVRIEAVNGLLLTVSSAESATSAAANNDEISKEDDSP